MSAGADIVLLRHGETTYNVAGLLNGDPAVAVPLTATGIRQCRALRDDLGATTWATIVVTPFGRTRASLDEILPGAAATVDPDLGDIRLGEFESCPRADYRAWRLGHGVADAPRGGESRVAALARYARAVDRLATRRPLPALVVTHDQPIRYLLNALAGADPIRGPEPPVANARPYPFAAAEIARGAAAMAAAAHDLAAR